MTVKQFLAWFDEFFVEWNEAVQKKVNAFLDALERLQTTKAFQEIKLVIDRINDFFERQELRLTKKKASRQYAPHRCERLKEHYPLFSQAFAPRGIGPRMGVAGGGQRIVAHNPKNAHMAGVHSGRTGAARWQAEF